MAALEPEFQRVKELLKEGARLTLDALRAAHPDETFYAFALYDADGSCVCTSANTEQRWQRKVAKYPDMSPAQAHWSTAEWAFEAANPAGREQLRQANQLLSELCSRSYKADPERHWTRFRARSFAASISALQELAAEGALSAGPAPVAALFSLSDDQDAAWLELESARRINPPEVFARIENELRESIRATWGAPPEPEELRTELLRILDSTEVPTIDLDVVESEKAAPGDNSAQQIPVAIRHESSFNDSCPILDRFQVHIASASQWCGIECKGHDAPVTSGKLQDHGIDTERVAECIAGLVGIIGQADLSSSRLVWDPDFEESMDTAAELTWPPFRLGTSMYDDFQVIAFNGGASCYFWGVQGTPPADPTVLGVNWDAFRRTFAALLKSLHPKLTGTFQVSAPDPFFIAGDDQWGCELPYSYQE